MPAALGTVASLGLLYLVARTAAAGVSPLVAAQLPPTDFSPLLRLAIYRSLAPNQRIPGALVDLSRKAAVTAPLAFEPFFILARHAEQQGRWNEAIRLMEEARRRRSNFPATRLQLASYYARTGRLDDLLVELDTVLRLRPNAIDPVMGELAKLIASADGRRVLAVALARKPVWHKQFVAIARGKNVRPEHALGLLNEVRRVDPQGDHRLERQLVMYALLDDGQINRARAMWLASMPPQDQSRYELMANSGFRGRPIEPPFGWDFRSSDVGRAKIAGSDSPQPHLKVEYVGGSSAILAEQALALRPGRYQFRVLARGERETGSSTVYWSIACGKGGAELVRITPPQTPGDFRRHQSPFTVPASRCDGQHIRLHGEAGDVPGTVDMEFAGVEILR
jgi:tetratricopeptide (TPR) repeat protein